MTLRRQIVDLARLGLLDDADQVGGVGQVAVVHGEAQILLVRILIEMVDTAGVEGRRAALDAVHHVALLQQEFRQIGAVLAGDPGHERYTFRHGLPVSECWMNYAP